jgi:hypothetical protein
LKKFEKYVPKFLFKDKNRNSGRENRCGGGKRKIPEKCMIQINK